MARNKVQFQKGLSLSNFLKAYGTEEQCFEALFAWRWPEGFRCPIAIMTSPADSLTESFSNVITVITKPR